MNILVTGCSRGVGLEICKVFLEQCHVVYGVARSHTEEFKALEAEYAGKLFFKSVDLSDSEGVRKAIFKEFVGNKIVLHAYVNNAAMAYDDIVTNLNLDRLKAMYDVNVFTPMMMTKYAIRNMLLHHTRGAIVHISSISAHTGYKGLAMSSAKSKEFRPRLSRRLSSEFNFSTAVRSFAARISLMISSTFFFILLVFLFLQFENILSKLILNLSLDYLKAICKNRLNSKQPTLHRYYYYPQ